MGLSSLPAVGHEPPSSDEASVIFPKHRRLNAMAYVLWPEPPGTPAFAAGSESSSGSAVPVIAAPISPISHSGYKWVLRPRKAKDVN